jgi:hypothetical protein
MPLQSVVVPYSRLESDDLVSQACVDITQNVRNEHELEDWVPRYPCTSILKYSETVLIDLSSHFERLN